MNILFTPWRFSYLTAPKGDQPSGCIFCIAATTDDVRQTLTLFRTPTRW